MTKGELIDTLALANAGIKKFEIQKEEALLQYAKDNGKYGIGDKVKLTSYNKKVTINIIDSATTWEDDYSIQYWVDKLDTNGKRTGKIQRIADRTIELIEKAKPTV